MMSNADQMTTLDTMTPVRAPAALFKPARQRMLALLLALAGCAVPPAPPPPVPAASPAAFKEDALWKRAGAQAEAAATVPQTWWRLFDDPVLDELQKRLVVGNETLKSAVAQVAAAQAALQASQAALWPGASLNVSASRGGNRVATTGTRITSNSLSLVAAASWELDLWGRLSNAVNAADASLQASQDDLAAARLSLQATLVQSYLSMRTAEAQQALLERTAAAYQQALELTRIRYNAGVVSQSDVLQAQTQLKTVQAQVKEATLQRSIFEHAIAALLGQPAAAVSIARADAWPRVPTIPLLLPATLLERRPDIAAAQRRVAAAYAQIGVADAAFFPAIGLSASAGHSGTSLAQVLNASSLLWSVGPSLAATLFDGGARRAASAQARAFAEQAGAVYRQTAILAMQEVEDNLAIVALLADELQLQQEALQAAQRNLQIVQEQYKAGTVSYLNVVTAQTSVLSAENLTLSVRNRQLAAANQLLKNIGGRWQTQ